MKVKVKDVFAGVTMPEETEQKIRRAMAEGKKNKRRHFRTIEKFAAIAALLALVFVISPTARAAVNNLVIKYFFPGSDITIYEETDANGDVMQITAVNTEAPSFARIVNARLYFVGNGEKIDITDQITVEEPYYYTYVDDYGLTHYMAVAYSGSIENFGIYEFIRDEEKGEWVTGTGRNFMNPETQSRYPWVDILWEEWNIPWPKPE